MIIVFVIAYLVLLSITGYSLYRYGYEKGQYHAYKAVSARLDETIQKIEAFTQQDKPQVGIFDEAQEGG